MKFTLMVVHSYYKEDSRVRREAEALVERGNRVCVICLNKGQEPKREIFKGVEILRSPVSRSSTKSKINYLKEYFLFFVLAGFSSLGFFFGRQNVTLFIAHNMPNVLIFLGVVHKLRGAKLILDMHDPMPELYENLFSLKNHFFVHLLRVEEKASAFLANGLIAANKPLAHKIGDRTGRSLFALHNTPDSRYVSAQNISDQKRDGIFNLFHHGNIHKRYGLDRALPLLASLNERSHEARARLVVYGKGPWYEEVQNKSVDMCVDKYCHFNGAFLPEQVPNLLSQASCGLVLNHRDELSDLLLPVKMLEYVAFCVPVICARSLAAEYYFDDSDVFFFETDEELEAQVRFVMENPGRAQEKARKAFHKIEEISWDREKQRFLDFVNAL